jgi:hypothetical protein
MVLAAVAKGTGSAAHSAQHLEPVHVGHAQVEQDGIDALSIELR